MLLAELAYLCPREKQNLLCPLVLAEPELQQLYHPPTYDSVQSPFAGISDQEYGKSMAQIHCNSFRCPPEVLLSARDEKTGNDKEGPKEGEAGGEYLALFAASSRFNHSCAPNAYLEMYSVSHQTLSDEPVTNEECDNNDSSDSRSSDGAPSSIHYQEHGHHNVSGDELNGGDGSEGSSCPPNRKVNQDDPSRHRGNDPAENFLVQNGRVVVGMVYSIEKISKGAEVCIAYRLVDMPTNLRQKFLRETWGFTCQCDRCSSACDMEGDYVDGKSHAGKTTTKGTGSGNETADGDIANIAHMQSGLKKMRILQSTQSVGQGQSTKEQSTRFKDDKLLTCVTLPPLQADSKDRCGDNSSSGNNANDASIKYMRCVNVLYDMLDPESAAFDSSLWVRLTEFLERIQQWFCTASKLHFFHWKKYTLRKYMTAIFQLQNHVDGEARALIELMEFECMFFPTYHPQRLKHYLAFQAVWEKCRLSHQKQQKQNTQQKATGNCSVDLHTSSPVKWCELLHLRDTAEVDWEVFKEIQSTSLKNRHKVSRVFFRLCV